MVEDRDAWNNGVGCGFTARIDGETEETCIFQSGQALGMDTQELYQRKILHMGGLSTLSVH